jgi:dolichol kinase
VPRVAPLLDAFMARFADERDSGPVYTTHAALLLGMAVPMWLAHAAESAEATSSGARTSDSGGAHAVSGAWFLVAASGMSCLGLGDSAASCVGVLAGRCRPFSGSKKTLEGTAAGACAMLLGWLAASRWLMPLHHGFGPWVSIGVVVATLGAALLEAVTHQLDNLVVPVFYAAHMLLLAGAGG